MKIYKCDICKKEIEERGRIERSTWDKFLDLCEECNNIYNKAEEEIAKRRKEIRIECEKKMKNETEKIFKKYKINIEEQ